MCLVWERFPEDIFYKFINTIVFKPILLWLYFERLLPRKTLAFTSKELIKAVRNPAILNEMTLFF